MSSKKVRTFFFAEIHASVLNSLYLFNYISVRELDQRSYLNFKLIYRVHHHFNWALNPYLVCSKYQKRIHFTPPHLA